MGEIKTIRHLKIYNTWRGMKERCTNPNHKNYNLYAGKLYKDWYGSRNFIAWAYENGYWEGATIDRIDPEGNYEPGNVQFISHSENTSKGNKQRRLTSYLYKNCYHTLKEISDLAKIPIHKAWSRLNRLKWSVEEVVHGK